MHYTSVIIDRKINVRLNMHKVVRIENDFENEDENTESFRKMRRAFELPIKFMKAFPSEDANRRFRKRIYLAKQSEKSLRNSF